MVGITNDPASSRHIKLRSGRSPGLVEVAGRHGDVLVSLFTLRAKLQSHLDKLSEPEHTRHCS